VRAVERGHQKALPNAQIAQTTANG
jgi:hypothetical protein